MAKHYARVKETTTTTGTGTLTRDGAVANFRPYDSVYSLNEFCDYWLIASDGQWERGWGKRTTATNFERTIVDESSNGGARIDLPVGTHILISGPNPASDSNRGVLLKRTVSSLSIPTGGWGGTPTILTFDGAAYDTDNVVGSFPVAAVILPDWVSKVRVSGAIRFSGSNAGTFREAFISGDDEFGKAPGLPWVSNGAGGSWNNILMLSSGVVERNFDSLRMYVNHDAGVSIDAFAGNNTWFCVEYVQ